MTRPKEKKSKRSVAKLMLDSGTTYHMTPVVDRVKNKKSCNVPIGLAGDSTIVEDSIGLR